MCLLLACVPHEAEGHETQLQRVLISSIWLRTVVEFMFSVMDVRRVPVILEAQDKFDTVFTLTLVSFVIGQLIPIILV